MISFIETDGNEKIRGEKMLRLWYAKTYVQARWSQGRNQNGKSQSISEIACVILVLRYSRSFMLSYE